MTIKNDKGITLVEVLIVVSMLAVLYLSLSKLIKYVSVAYWKNTSQLVLQEEARSAMHYITQELRSSRASSIGITGPFDSPVTAGDGEDRGINTSFEFPYGAGTPYAWNDLVPNQIVKISSSGGPRSGIYCICLNPLAIGQFTYTSLGTIQVLGPAPTYLVSIWFKTASAKTFQFEINTVPVTAPVHTQVVAAAQDWQWEHFVRLVPFNAGPSSYTLSLTNLENDTSIYFDDISVSTGAIIMDVTPASAVTAAMYQKTEKDNNLVRRIRYQPATGTTGIENRGKLYLEEWQGGSLANMFAPGANVDWKLIEPNPLCQYVSTFRIDNIVNNNFEQHFDIILELTNDEPQTTSSSGVRTYRSEGRVFPYLP
ncbi:MAG: prepilin-type N-terminal cleavage/methylation domain-containing protein [bacterium]|nr:prepilin-type N-terminal cleavage/methylation domain-containing protein [bacterium]MDD5354029.1 prepilin-type N-terminal cleavage/methylation domain-containing protein [bacterium]MDD5755980.1 prepilin-type N-terminal cleavage/methylation domain-containing protein [bacterium]